MDLPIESGRGAGGASQNGRCRNAGWREFKTQRKEAESGWTVGRPSEFFAASIGGPGRDAGASIAFVFSESARRSLRRPFAFSPSRVVAFAGKSSGHPSLKRRPPTSGASVALLDANMVGELAWSQALSPRRDKKKRFFRAESLRAKSPCKKK
jgi:hypothetical protein